MVLISCALYCEAKPLIRFYSLKKHESNMKMEVYANDNMAVIITGTGRVSSAAGISHLLTLFDSKDNIALNIGICAGIKYNIKDILLINKIKDMINNRDYYPDILFNHSYKEASIATFLKPVKSAGTLPDGYDLADMEAAGFFNAVSYYLPLHKIGIIKTVSDNFNFCTLTPSIVSDILTNSLYDFDKIINLYKNNMNGTFYLTQDESDMSNKVSAILDLSFSNKKQFEKLILMYKKRKKKFPLFLEKYCLREKYSRKDGKKEFEKIRTDFEKHLGY